MEESIRLVSNSTKRKNIGLMNAIIDILFTDVFHDYFVVLRKS